jgi:hypothetical protein
MQIINYATARKQTIISQENLYRASKRTHPEKRINCRYPIHLPILCTIFNSHEFNDKFEGRMKNYSQFGIGALFDNRLPGGTVILVQAIAQSLEYFSSKFRVGFRSTTLAEVKWSKPIETEAFIQYLTGLKYVSVI